MFLESLDFVIGEPRMPADANRNPGPQDGPVLPARLQIG